MRSEEHRDIREQLGEYALGRQSADVKAHLEACAQCRSELAELVPLVSALGRVNPDRLDSLPSPPVELRERIGRAVGVQKRARLRTDGVRRAAVVVAAAATLAAVFVLGTQVGGGDTPPVEAVAASTALSGTDIEAGLVAHTWGTEIKLAAAGLQQGGIYQVTFLRRDGQTVPAGTFIGTGDERLRCSLNAALPRAEAVAVTVTDTSGMTVMRAELA